MFYNLSFKKYSMKQHLFRFFTLFLSITLFSILLDYFYYGLNLDNSLLSNIDTIHSKIIATIVVYLIFNAKGILKKKRFL